MVQIYCQVFKSIPTKNFKIQNMNFFHVDRYSGTTNLSSFVIHNKVQIVDSDQSQKPSTKA